MSEAKRTNYVSVVMTDDELRRLDDWAWQRRIRARSDAIRQLIERGFGVEDPAPEPEPEPAPKSPRKPASTTPAPASKAKTSKPMRRSS